MAQQATDDANKTKVSEEFTKIRELLNKRETELVEEIDKAADKSINVQFESDALANLISSFGKVEIEEKDDSKSTEIVVLALDSSILSDETEIGKLSQVLAEKLGRKDIKLSLLYRSSRDENTKEAFHKHCDGKGATLTLVRTDFNHVFGCFTSIEWKTEPSKYYADDTAFVCLLRSSFGHETPRVYTIENEKYKPKAVYHNLNYGPAFGHGQDIGIDPPTENNPTGNSWIKSGYSYMLNGNALCGNKETKFEEGGKRRYFFTYSCYEVFAVE